MSNEFYETTLQVRIVSAQPLDGLELLSPEVLELERKGLAFINYHRESEELNADITNFILKCTGVTARELRQRQDSPFKLLGIDADATVKFIDHNGFARQVTVSKLVKYDLELVHLVTNKGDEVAIPYEKILAVL